MSKRAPILDRSLSKGKGEINISTFALLFAELVKYSERRVYTVPELQQRLSDLGQRVGERLVDVVFARERGKRETKLLSMLLFVKGNLWRTLFAKEADKLERSTDDESTYYLIEKEPLVNRYISVPRDKGSLNCAAFVAGILEAFLTNSGFSCKVTVHWHKGTTFMMKFDESVMTRERTAEGK